MRSGLYSRNIGCRSGDGTADGMQSANKSKGDFLLIIPTAPTSFSSSSAAIQAYTYFIASRKELSTTICISTTVERYYTNTQKFCIPIYLLFPPLFDFYDFSKCEIRFERIPENYTRSASFQGCIFHWSLHFSWHSQNEVGNIGILVLVGDCEKLLVCYHPYQ